MTTSTTTANDDRLLLPPSPSSSLPPDTVVLTSAPFVASAVQSSQRTGQRRLEAATAQLCFVCAEQVSSSGRPLQRSTSPATAATVWFALLLSEEVPAGEVATASARVPHTAAVSCSGAAVVVAVVVAVALNEFAT